MDTSVVAIGDGGVGKTSLITRLKEGHFLEDYDPTIEEAYRKQFSVDNETVIVDFTDTYGQEYPRVLEQYFKSGKGFFLIYSITSLSSFDEIHKKYEEILIHRDDAVDTSKIPMVLIANKSDLESQRAVSREMGEELAKRYRIPFFETSAKNDVNVTESLHALIREIRRQADEPRKIDTAVNNNTKKDKKGNCKLS